MEGMQELGRVIGIDTEGDVESWLGKMRQKLEELKTEVWYWLILYEINDNMNSKMEIADQPKIKVVVRKRPLNKK